MLVSDPTVVTMREIFSAKAVLSPGLAGRAHWFKERECQSLQGTRLSCTARARQSCAWRDSGLLLSLLVGTPGRKGQSRIGSAFPALTHGRKRKAA